MKKNLFIAFEGIDGSGKSTQVKLLSYNLKNAGYKVYVTCEPTDGPIGKMIRDIFSHKMEADHRTIAGLFIADRLDHLLNKTNGVLKKLEEGFTVITDRYYFSSYAYHGAHMDMKWVIDANAMSAELLRPDLNIYLDIDPEASMDRLHSDRPSLELFENVENLKIVRNKYHEAIELLRHEENVFMLDAHRAPHIIASEIWNEVSQLLVETGKHG